MRLTDYRLLKGSRILTAMLVKHCTAHYFESGVLFQSSKTTTKFTDKVFLDLFESSTIPRIIAPNLTREGTITIILELRMKKPWQSK